MGVAAVAAGEENEERENVTDSINPNDYVRVKLTEAGKRLIVKGIDAANDMLRARKQDTMRFSVPKWDEDGWIRGQFHSLMSYFGESWKLGNDAPFSEMEKA